MMATWVSKNAVLPAAAAYLGRLHRPHIAALVWNQTFAADSTLLGRQAGFQQPLAAMLAIGLDLVVKRPEKGGHGEIRARGQHFARMRRAPR